MGCGLAAALTTGANAEPATASRCLFQPVRSSRGSLRRQPSARWFLVNQRVWIDTYDPFFSIREEKTRLLFYPSCFSSPQRRQARGGDAYGTSGQLRSAEPRECRLYMTGAKCRCPIFSQRLRVNSFVQLI